MATVKDVSDGQRKTRQSTTRASISAHPSAPVQDVYKQPPFPEIRSRRNSSSTISSLSPSPQKKAFTLPTPTPLTQATNGAESKPSRVSRDKGKGKAVEPFPQEGQARPSKRVLPARIRRAAGGGQEGFRDLENMIVDWLDRYGTSSRRCCRW